MSEHTPGPWKVRGLDGDTILIGTDDLRLIAAAPDLLKALEAMIRHVEIEWGRLPFEAYCQDALDAIAKAKGERGSDEDTWG